MRYPVVVVAGLIAIGVVAVPAQAAAPEGKYWRVEVTRTAEHGRPVGSGYSVTERSVSVDWLTTEGRGWVAHRKLGAIPTTKKDEAAWRADGSPTSWTYRTEGMKISLSTRPDKGFLKRVDEDGFRLGEKQVTYKQLQALPTEPEALRAHVTAEVRAWIDEAAEEAKTTSPKSKIDDWLVKLDRYVAQRMINLLYENPVPFKVRSAAFQALKTTKGVSDLGRAKDPLGRSGHKVALPVSAQKGDVLKEQFIVDTKTMTLLAHDVDLKHDGKPVGGKSGVETYKTGWTDAEPAIPAAR
ncbi:hypothetical protein [Nonomuraea basaltis]|uniref:hypothetical protein n=1 Tax=Nonomuraea basaltis TaxID=2495887 RepID=UPI00110C4F95|nr:hypothetical protein [Nonomuraea basaltis]TMR98125.1 hypothetical protein EJK15_14120 [Nonomuraea basaltis]